MDSPYLYYPNEFDKFMFSVYWHILYVNFKLHVVKDVVGNTAFGD